MKMASILRVVLNRISSVGQKLFVFAVFAIWNVTWMGYFTVMPRVFDASLTINSILAAFWQFINFA